MDVAREPVNEGDLHAWVDGRLMLNRKEAIETYFAAHPEARGRWSQYSQQRTALRAAFAAQVAGPIPARLWIVQLIEERQCR